MIIHRLDLCTKLDVWKPKYSAKYGEAGEEVALLHKRKVDFGSPIIVVNFPRAKHLQGQRFCIRKQDAQKHEVGNNGKARMYLIPMSHFQPWELASEVRDLALSLFEDEED